MGWFVGFLEAHRSGKSHSEVSVEHFAADRNPAEIHVQTHQAKCLSVHGELLSQLGADVESLGLGQIDQPGPDVGAGPVAGIDGQSIGTVVDFLGGRCRRCYRSRDRGDCCGTGMLTVTVMMMVRVMSVGVRVCPPAVTFIRQYADRGQIQRRDAPLCCAFYLHRGGFSFDRNL